MFVIPAFGGTKVRELWVQGQPRLYSKMMSQKKGLTGVTILKELQLPESGII
jgi:hypothetical protein